MNYQTALNKLWTEVSYRKLFKLKNFFQDLILLQRYDLRFISPEKLKIAFDSHLLPDCANCPENCCHGAENTVSLRLIDIARLLDANLAEAIDLDNRSFRQDKYFKKNPHALRLVSNDSWKFFPVLKRVNNICPYLDKDNRCSIYQHRPITCRRFPYIITSDKKNIVFSQKCHKTKLTNNKNQQETLLNAAIDSYNEKIKDLILLHYARKELSKIGLIKYLNITE
jgi:Fe-S-cluster containining protein